VDGRGTLYGELDSKPAFYANSIRATQPAFGRLGYLSCLDFYRVDDGLGLALLQMDRFGSGALFGLGQYCNGVAIDYYLVELGMILRLSQKLNAKIKSGKLGELPLAANPYADWSCHLFTVARLQYIILMNTASFYACIMPGRGLTNTDTFVKRAAETIRDFTADDAQQFVYRKFVVPSYDEFHFAKALNRSVTGSMNDHIHGAKHMISRGIEAAEVGFLLNKTPMSALVGPRGPKYNYPREVFANLADRMRNG
jgi:hypothetical protein